MICSNGRSFISIGTKVLNSSTELLPSGCAIVHYVLYAQLLPRPQFIFKSWSTSMLVPGDPGRLGTHVYVFTVESPQPMGARHTSCTPLLWKPHDTSRGDTTIYLVTFETSRLLGARNTSCKQLLWKPRDPSRQGPPIYIVIFETSRPMGQGTVHVSSYCGNPPIRAGKAHSSIYLPFKLATRRGKEHFMYAVTAETPRPEKGRHALLLSYIWNVATPGGKAQFM
jgi:hypothetical protein